LLQLLDGVDIGGGPRTRYRLDEVDVTLK